MLYNVTRPASHLANNDSRVARPECRDASALQCDPDPAMSATIVFFAHDLSDPGVHRGVRMLRGGGADVTPMGSRRSAEAQNAVGGLRPIALGRTADRMLARRMLSV